MFLINLWRGLRRVKLGRTNVAVKSSNGQKLMNEAKYLLMRVNHDEQLGNPCVI